MITIQLECDGVDLPNIDKDWISGICNNILKDFEHNSIVLVNGSYHSSDFKYVEKNRIKISSYEQGFEYKFSKIAKDMNNSGKKIISLGLGEPSFETPKHIKNAAYILSIWVFST